MQADSCADVDADPCADVDAHADADVDAHSCADAQWKQLDDGDVDAVLGASGHRQVGECNVQGGISDRGASVLVHIRQCACSCFCSGEPI